MCGIAGFWNKDHSPAEKNILEGMLKKLKRRGPDGEGVFIQDHIALGHRRLAVIDLCTGAQPLDNEDGSIQVTFNGEIFNYKQLREELTGKGHRFKTVSDTEVLLHLYEEYGNDMTSRLDGFFAFALYDSNQQKLLLARDRLGIKPLFYFQTDRNFVFASSIAALRQHPDFPDELDPQAIWDYLSLLYIPHDTVYKKVCQLEPGTILETGAAFCRKTRYWDANRQKRLDISYEDACHELDRLVRNAVKDRMISDVPLGVFLSGGIDSTIIAGLAAEISDGPLRCYSIGFKEKAYDEREFANQNAEWIRQFAKNGLEHHVKQVDPCDAGILQKLITEYGQPFADASQIPTYLLSSFARENVTVALSGDGADEVFYGYERYIAMRYLEHFDCIPYFLRKIMVEICSTLFRGGNERSRSARILRFLKGTALSGTAARYLGIISHTDELVKKSFCGDFFQDVAPTLTGFDKEHFLQKAADVPDFDLHTYLPGDILTKADTASMTASLEVRSPFLDYKTLEFAAALPPEFKEHGGKRKRILCDTFAKYLPPGAAARRKRGFGVPLADWFRNEWQELILSTLLVDSEGIKRGIFSADGISHLIADHLSGKDRSYALFSAMVLELFLRNEKA